MVGSLCGRRLKNAALRYRTRWRVFLSTSRFVTVRTLSRTHCSISGRCMRGRRSRGANSGMIEEDCPRDRSNLTTRGEAVSGGR